MTSKIEILSNISPDDIYPFIDKGVLFSKQWQMGRSISREESEKILEGWKLRAKKELFLTPTAAIGYFSANTLNKLSIDLKGLKEPIPLMIATVGNKVVREKERLFKSHNYSDAFYLNGFAGAMAEALTEYAHRYILKQMGGLLPEGKKLAVRARISPGYKAWPNIKDQAIICDLLSAEKIGVTVTESFQLVPEYSTSAIIII